MIKYESIEDYKYRITEDYAIKTGILGFSLHSSNSQGCVELHADGLLIIYKGFLSDGPSGPTIDTKDSMRAAFVHDALYKLMRVGLLPLSFRKKADKILYKIARKDGMPRFRALYWYWGVRICGKSSAEPKEE